MSEALARPPRDNASHRLLVNRGFHEARPARLYRKLNGVWEDHLLLSPPREDLAR